MRELAVLEREVDDRVEGGRPGEQARMAGDEEEGLLAAHAPADRVDTVRVDVHPRQRELDDLRHAGEVVDLAGASPTSSSTAGGPGRPGSRPPKPPTAGS